MHSIEDNAAGLPSALVLRQAVLPANPFVATSLHPWALKGCSSNGLFHLNLFDTAVCAVDFLAFYGAVRAYLYIISLSFL